MEEEEGTPCTRLFQEPLTFTLPQLLATQLDSAASPALLVAAEALLAEWAPHLPLCPNKTSWARRRALPLPLQRDPSQAQEAMVLRPAEDPHQRQGEEEVATVWEEEQEEQAEEEQEVQVEVELAKAMA